MRPPATRPRRPRPSGGRVVIVRVSEPKNVLAGLVFAAAGAGFATLSLDHELGSPARMGPGLFPLVLALGLSGLGVGIALSGIARGKPAGAQRRGEGLDPPSAFPLRPLLFVPCSVALFGALLSVLGLVAAVVALVGVAALAGERFRLRETVVLALALALFSAAVFVLGLGLPLRLWPDLAGG